MSELKWNWVYYPYLDSPNKQEESALKAGYIKVVSKDDADNVIAEKDMEIFNLKEELSYIKADSTFDRDEYEELLKSKDAEIVELKKACDDKDDWCLHTLKENRHNKYKRCLAMAKWCYSANYIACWYHEDSQRCEWTKKWYKRWMGLANKFKEGK